jgi:preprotein translocase subunit SecA
MNQQRKVVYAERKRILEGEDLADQAHAMLVDVITAYVDGATSEGYAEDWDLESLWSALKLLYPVGIDHHDLVDGNAVGEPGELTRDELLDALIADAEKAYAAREAELTELGGDTAMRQLERTVLLTTVDRKWREHLYEMDYLREGINLRAHAQRDPVVEYQREGFDMFVGMMDAVKEESVGLLFNAQVQGAAPQPAVAPMAAPPNLAQFAADAAAKAQEAGAGSSVATEDRTPKAPVALRVKGIGDLDDGPQLTYSGPSEDGSAQVQRQGGQGGQGQAAGAGRHATPSRRERREAARKQPRGGPKARRG